MIKFIILCIFIINFKMFADGEYDGMPPETIVLKIENDKESNWKLVHRVFSPEQFLVEYIPENQRIENWSELVVIEAHNVGDKQNFNLETFLEIVKTKHFEASKGNKTSWNILDKTNHGIIYEFEHQSPDHDLLNQYEVAYASLSGNWLHRVGYALKNSENNPSKKAKCLKLLRENVTLNSYQKATDNNIGLFIKDETKISLNLEQHFKDWQIVFKRFDHITKVIGRIPPGHFGNLLNETFTVATYNCSNSSIDAILEESKRKNIGKTLNIYKKTPHEAIYSLSVKNGKLKQTDIARTFLLEKGYCTLNYMQILPDEMNNDQISKMINKLESIHVVK